MVLSVHSCKGWKHGSGKPGLSLPVSALNELTSMSVCSSLVWFTAFATHGSRQRASAFPELSSPATQV